jgi:hypothetical protein
MTSSNIRPMAENEVSKMDAVLDYMTKLLGTDLIFVVVAMNREGHVDMASNTRDIMVGNLLIEAAEVFNKMPQEIIDNEG